MSHFLLLIDNNPTDYFRLTAFLGSRYRGLGCIWCQSFAGAASVLQRVDPLLILVGYDAYIDHGVEIVVSLRHIQKLKDVIILLYGPLPAEDLRTMAMASGASGVLQKNDSWHSLAELESWLDRLTR